MWAGGADPDGCGLALRVGREPRGLSNEPGVVVWTVLCLVCVCVCACVKVRLVCIRTLHLGRYVRVYARIA